MHRQLADSVQKLLQRWNETKTHLHVLGKGISLRNWVAFCAAEGALDGRRRKLRELAEVLKVSVPRVSAVLKNVRNRLVGNDTGRTKLGLLRDYRSGRYSALKCYPIVNAKTVESLTRRFRIRPSCWATDRLGWNCHVIFLADGKSLQIEKSSIHGRYVINARFMGCGICSMLKGYVVLWAKDSDGNTNNTAASIFGSPKCIREASLLIDYNGAFWVEDKVEVVREEKCLVVFLKPAEYAKKDSP